MNFFDESFWLAVSFIVFVYIAYRPIKKSILKSIDSKILEIKEQVQEAANLKKDAALFLEKAQAELANLDKFRQELVARTISDTDKIISERSLEMQSLLNMKQNEAVNALETQKTHTSAEIRGEFTELAIKIANKYLEQTNNNNASDLEIARNFLSK